MRHVVVSDLVEGHIYIVRHDLCVDTPCYYCGHGSSSNFYVFRSVDGEIEIHLSLRMLRRCAFYSSV